MPEFVVGVGVLRCGGDLLQVLDLTGVESLAVEHDKIEQFGVRETDRVAEFLSVTFDNSFNEAKVLDGA